MSPPVIVITVTIDKAPPEDLETIRRDLIQALDLELVGQGFVANVEIFP